MDAGIGAASRHGLDRTMGVEGRDRSLQSLLDAGQVALPLPTIKQPSVVLDAEGDPAKGTGGALRIGIGNRQRSGS
jgi:hypothetical protein